MFGVSRFIALVDVPKVVTNNFGMGSEHLGIISPASPYRRVVEYIPTPSF